MPYPAKTTAQLIIDAAIAQLETGGWAGLSMRTLATALRITPHALYRYFPDRAALEAAIAEASYRELLEAMRHASDDQAPFLAVAAAAAAYIAFAEAHPARYELMFAASHEPATKSPPQVAIWQLVLALLARVTGQTENDDAGLALWALLHGFVVLESVGIAQGRTHIDRGLALFLAGLTSATKP